MLSLIPSYTHQRPTEAAHIRKTIVRSRPCATMAVSATLAAPFAPSDEVPAIASEALGFSHITSAFRAATSAALSRQRCDALVLEPVLCAMTTFLTVFDALGSAVITQLVATDFRWKTDAVRTAMARLDQDEGTELRRAEEENPPGFFEASGIDGMQWMRRVLEFVDALVLCLLTDKNVELKDAAATAYRGTIGLRHNSVAKVMFENALLLMPDKSAFIHNLFGIKEPTETQMGDIEKGMREFRTAIRPHIDSFTRVFQDE